MPAVAGAQCVSLTTAGSPYNQNFDSLASTGTSSIVPAGWAFLETGTNANSTYTAGTGSGNTGDTYSFGTTTDRAFGTLLSGSLVPAIGACFTNNTGSIITSLAIAYTGEEWRLGTAGRADQLLFEYSLNATALNTGTWTAFAPLNFTTPDTVTVGAKNGNAAADRTAISATIGSLSIPNGATLWIRWRDFDASGADDGLAVDDFSLTPTTGAPTPTNPSATGAAAPSPVTAGASVTLTATVTPGANPTSTGLAAACDLTAIGGSNAFSLPSPGFSAPYIVPAGTAAQVYNLPCTVTDDQTRTGSFTVAVTVASPSVSPAGSGSASPASLLAGTSTLLTVNVLPGSNPASTGLAVTADLTAIGGSASQQFFDDGVSGGDQVAGDHIYSFNATVAANIVPGSKSLPVTITDAQSRTGSSSISLTVQFPAAPTTVKISQIYGGGGNSGATYTNDFFEIFNQSNAAVDISNWSIQQTSAAGAAWTVTRLCPVNGSCVLGAGHYYLVQLAAGTSGTTPLPTADAVGTVNLGATSGKVALVANTITLPSIACPTGNGIVDFVGYGGSSANCSEASPAAAPSNTAAVVRKGNGCIDSDNNANDFVVVGPIPRNSSAPVNVCGGNPAQPSGVGIAVPGALESTALTLLTVAVTPATAPPSTGIAVTGNLASIGGAPSQQFYDDGTHGDLVAGDNIFSFSAAAPVATGVYYIPATITDAQGRTAPSPITFTVTSPTCGVERWNVKVGTDPDAGLVNLANPVRSTISAMRALPAPVLNDNPPYDPRMAPTETTVFVLNGTITFYKLEDDVDYHIVLQDAAGNTMVTEIPSPACDGSTSPFSAGIALARAKLNTRLTPTDVFQVANLSVQMKGVGFFDFLHGQTGVAPNGIELHPILDLTFTSPTTAALQSSANPSQYGQSMSITASVTSNGGATPTGNVTLLDGGNTIASGILDPNGRSTFALSTLTVGTHPFTLSYDGDSASAPSVSPVLTQVVNKADQTIDFAPLANRTYGDAAFNVTATASSTLAVSFTASGACTIAGNTVTIISAGSCTVTASQAGSDNYNAAAPVARPFNINPAAQAAVTVTAPSDAAYGQTGLVAGATGGSGTGAYSFSAGVSTACSVNATTGAITVTGGTGVCAITASRAGDSNYNDSPPSAPATVNIHKAPTTTTAASSKAPSTYGDAVSFSATVAPNAATGMVQFQIDGNNFGAPVAVANGTAVSGSTAALSAGSHTVGAIYSGDTNYAGTTGSVIQMVNRVATAAAVNSTANPSTYGQQVSFTAAVSSAGGVPTGTVTFLDGTSALGTSPLNAQGQAALTTAALPAGGHSISSVYNGDTNFLGSTSAVLAQTVAPANTATVLVANINPAAVGQSVNFAAAVTAKAPGTGTPTGTITFRDGTTALATVPLNGLGQALLSTAGLALGTHSLTATYSGDANFTASTSAAVSELIYTGAGGGGSFVIGDLDAVVGKQVTFWSSQWDKVNHLSGGSAPSSFSGYANAVDGATWTSDSGNSSAPPSTVPAYMAVIAASSITKNGATIQGNAPLIVIVKTDPGYQPNGGHDGTGTVVAMLPVTDR
jgi:Bacterial Ig-like domain (group 3)/Lamin Tail Domain